MKTKFTLVCFNFKSLVQRVIMDRDIEMEENNCRIAQRLEFPLSDEEDLHEASSTTGRTSSNISSDRLDSSGSDEGLGMTIRITSPRKPRFIRSRARESMSPPYSGVRALRLFDSPATPKTLLENSSAIMTPVLATPAPRNRMRTLFNMSSAKSTGKFTQQCVFLSPFSMLLEITNRN